MEEEFWMSRTTWERLAPADSSAFHVANPAESILRPSMLRYTSDRKRWLAVPRVPSGKSSSRMLAVVAVVVETLSSLTVTVTWNVPSSL